MGSHKTSIGRQYKVVTRRKSVGKTIQGSHKTSIGKTIQGSHKT